jgi:hypothetical protein
MLAAIDVDSEITLAAVPKVFVTVLRMPWTQERFQKPSTRGTRWYRSMWKNPRRVEMLKSLPVGKTAKSPIKPDNGRSEENSFSL